jgi:formylglycine-generating enzyme required for sulfatase activity
VVELAPGVELELALIPEGEFVMGADDGFADEAPRAVARIGRPFWMGRLEVSNAQYAAFDPLHDSRVESMHGYQFGFHGFPLNRPEQPVVRVSWSEAQAFCRWLGARTGETFALPTEAQWEWACRAGAATPLAYGDLDTDFSKLANLGDARLAEYASCSARGGYTRVEVIANPNRFDDWVPKEARFDDGAFLTVAGGDYQANAWGLHDMHGNVWEWTRSAYQPYPYRGDDGRNDPAAAGVRVVRGGSWYDRPYRARSAFRLAYEPHQPVYNVGFRVVCEVAAPRGAAAKVAVGD